MSDLFNIGPYCIDDRGAVPHGKVWVYHAGSVGFAKAYADKEGNLALCNPAILDSRGDIDGIFLKPGEYCVHLKGDSELNPRGWIKDNWKII